MSLRALTIIPSFKLIGFEYDATEITLFIVIIIDNHDGILKAMLRRPIFI